MVLEEYLDMNEILHNMKEKTESILQTKIISINQCDNITNNMVYIVETITGSYIFKIYNNKSWPEDRKLSFVSKKLSESGIPHAKIITYNRDDSYFTNGFLIEECLPGFTADKRLLAIEEEISLYKKLAKLVSNLHQIRLVNCGYIGSGEAKSESLSAFVEESYEYHINNLIKYNLFSNEELVKIKDKLIAKFDQCSHIPPVLCHGDLSKKNIMIGTSDDITLIDWDDAQSLCWMADVARLTLWMSLNYDKDNAGILRDVFLENYTTTGDKNIFYDFEEAFHVWLGLDYLNFFVGTPQYEKTLTFFRNVITKL